MEWNNYGKNVSILLIQFLSCIIDQAFSKLGPWGQIIHDPLPLKIDPLRTSPVSATHRLVSASPVFAGALLLGPCEMLWNAVKRMANGESFNWHFLILSGSSLGCLESKIVSTVIRADWCLRYFGSLGFEQSRWMHLFHRTGQTQAHKWTSCKNASVAASFCLFTISSCLSLICRFNPSVGKKTTADHHPKISQIYNMALRCFI